MPTVLITGCSSGYGLATARHFHARGWQVLATMRRPDPALFADAPGVRVLALDVTDPDSIARAVGEAGTVDVLVNNAGIGTAVPATKETPEQFSSVVEINLHGTYWMAQAAARVMQPGSSIVNISSVLGLTTAALPQAGPSRSRGKTKSVRRIASCLTRLRSE